MLNFLKVKDRYQLIEGLKTIENTIYPLIQIFYFYFELSAQDFFPDMYKF